MSIGSWHRIAPLGAGDFPAGTPLCRFFAWNEAAGRKDRRYIIARDIWTLFRAFGGGEAAHAMCVAHLSRRPLVTLRLGARATTVHVRLQSVSEVLLATSG